jgi:hypothetical protein|tara:strand:+ start:576 stop:794 length:219 start_codon:yes stop_codon:yes gene_type:complete
MSQREMFQPEIYMTDEDTEIAIEVLDESGFFIDDSTDTVVMRDCVRLSERGFYPGQITSILESTNHRPFSVV